MEVGGGQGAGDPGSAATHEHCLQLISPRSMSALPQRKALCADRMRYIQRVAARWRGGASRA